jgi:hypothetical protein
MARIFADLDFQHLSSPYPQGFELLSIKNATTRYAA